MRVTISGRTPLSHCSGVTAISRPAALICILCLGVVGESIAESYFIDASRGNDSWSGTRSAPSSEGGPWKSLSRLAEITLRAGDSVFLHCAGIWHEPLTIQAKGTAESKISVAPYGDCPNTRPTIRPTKTMTTAAGSAVQKIRLETGPKMVVVDNQVAPRARFPVEGYLALQEKNGNWQLPLEGIPTNNLALKGADLVVRVNDYTIEERRLYNVEANGEFTVAKPFGLPIAKGAGAYLEGKAWMIAKPNHWAYDEASQELHIRLPNSITALEVALPGNAITINSSDYLTLRGLTVAFAEQHGILVSGSRNVRLESITVTDVGSSFVNATNSEALVIDDLRGERSQRNGVVAQGNAVTVTNSDLSEIGTSKNLRKSIAAIELSYAVDAVVTNNRIKQAGYSAIMFGKRARIENNNILEACTRLADCGAIYTSGAGKKLGLYGAVIRNNVISGVPGNIDGTSTKHALTAGIYLDDESAGIAVENNHVEFAQRGIFSKAHSSRITGNTLFGNKRAIFLTNAGARGNGRTDGTELGANRIISTDRQAPIVIVGTNSDQPLAIPDKEHFWIPKEAKPAETWVGNQRSSDRLGEANAGLPPPNQSISTTRITQARSILNFRGTTARLECPFPASDCIKVRLLAGEAVAWPIILSPNSAEVVVIPK